MNFKKKNKEQTRKRALKNSVGNKKAKLNPFFQSRTNKQNSTYSDEDKRNIVIGLLLFVTIMGLIFVLGQREKTSSEKESVSFIADVSNTGGKENAGTSQDSNFTLEDVPFDVAYYKERSTKRGRTEECFLFDEDTDEFLNVTFIKDHGNINTYINNGFYEGEFNKAIEVKNSAESEYSPNTSSYFIFDQEKMVSSSESWEPNTDYRGDYLEVFKLVQVEKAMDLVETVEYHRKNPDRYIR